MTSLMLAAMMTAAVTTGCSDDTDAVQTIDMQTSLTYFDAGESYKSDLWVKPYVGYVGDPMPYYDKAAGVFRVLYLHDMRDGNSTIYHPIHQLTTVDGASYTNLNEAVPCGSAAEDDPAIGTGGMIEAGGKYYLYYTGHKAASPREVILRATSVDGEHWTKDRSFRLQAPDGYDRDEFRDPCVFYDDEARLYRMVISTLRDGKSVLAQYTSADLESWTLAEPFFQNKWGRFYECPDIFKMGDYWYLVYSDKDVTRQVQYFYAPTLRELMSMGGDPQFPPRDEGKLEGTQFYAGKTASDGTDRYIWGWCATRQGNLTEGVADWAGALVMHRLVQNADGTLGLDIVPAIDNMLADAAAPVEMSRTDGVEGSADAGYTLKGGQSVRFSRLAYMSKIEFDAQTQPGTAVFGIAFADASDRGYNYRVYIEDRWSNLKLDRTATADDGTTDRQNINAHSFVPPADGKYHITVVTDHSVCAVYVNGQYAFTNRIYGEQRNPWSLFCSDGSVSVSNISYSAR